MELPEHLDQDDWDLMRAVAIGGPAVKGRTDASRIAEHVIIEAASCSYSCCSKGWHRREYASKYKGWLDNLTDRTVMLYSAGIGTMNYTVAVRFDEITDIYSVGESY